VRLARTVAVLAALSTWNVAEASAVGSISDAKLEKAILQKPELFDPLNRKIVPDLRALRDCLGEEMSITVRYRARLNP
jgi:hypothetical protein